MKYNFDEDINRAGTDCYKYDMRNEIFGTDDLLPMWVADSDFKTAPEVMDAIEARCKHGVFGYTFTTDDYFNAIIHWNKNRHNWDLQKEWIHFSPGVVPSLNLAVMSLTEPGDNVIVQTPVYFPFYSAITAHERNIIRNPLVLENGRYRMDLDDLKKKIDKKTKLLFLCSPHNPTSNVWSKNELMEICQLCIENDIIILSDEIHADLIFSGYKHIPTATLSEEIAQRTVTLMAPSKTFNIAGLSSSYIVSKNKELLDKMTWLLRNLHLTNGNLFGLTATIAAYNKGAAWVDEMMTYIENSAQYVDEFLKTNLPKVKLIKPEGTYLLWMDFREIGMDRKELNEILINKAKVGFSDGAMFGKEGAGFQRMNIACPKSYVEHALKSIVNVLQ
ncbi:MAG: pyridoxal phosphate-dependent aminotransferase [Bacteroidales bacterium]|nr:pyridoxal phosphate-dependent aminotransferase [Bacteroidales bacterium]